MQEVLLVFYEALLFVLQNKLYPATLLTARPSKRLKCKQQWISVANLTSTVTFGHSRNHKSEQSLEDVLTTQGQTMSLIKELTILSLQQN